MTQRRAYATHATACMSTYLPFKFQFKENVKTSNTAENVN